MADQGQAAPARPPDTPLHPVRTGAVASDVRVGAMDLPRQVVDMIIDRIPVPFGATAQIKVEAVCRGFWLSFRRNNCGGLNMPPGPAAGPSQPGQGV